MNILEILSIGGVVLGLLVFLLFLILGEFSWRDSSISTLITGIIILFICLFLLNGFVGVPLLAIGSAMIILAVVLFSLPYFWSFIRTKWLN